MKLDFERRIVEKMVDRSVVSFPRSKGTTSCQCSRCDNEQRCAVLSWIAASDEEFAHVYEILQCRNCDTVFFRDCLYSHESEHWYETIHPYASCPKLPVWLSSAKDKILTNLFRETDAALRSDSLTLAACGVRAILDRLMTNLVGDAGGFQEKVLRMREHGYIGQRDANQLKTVVEFGSAAAHRGYRPTRDDVVVAFQVVENMAQRMLVLERPLKSLQGRVPTRRKSKPAAPAARVSIH